MVQEQRGACGEVFLFSAILFLLHSETFHVSDSVPGRCAQGGRTGKKSKEETGETAEEESSLPVLACPSSPSRKHHNIRRAPASSGFLVLPQCPCCLRLSRTPVNRASGVFGFCFLLGYFLLCVLESLPLPQAAAEAGGRCDAAPAQQPMRAPPESAYLFAVLVLLRSSLLVRQEIKQNERP